MKKVGILGGTFDPPHMGHLIIADEVKHVLNLDEIWFIPTNVPPHKQQATSSSRHRVAMLELAIAHTPYFKINPIELERDGKSYTIDTIKLLKQRHTDTIFYFIIGADMVEYLPNWYKVEELVSMVEFVGVKRPHYRIETNYAIDEVEVPLIDISSTKIKNRIKEKKAFHFLIPEAVYHYIKEERLYDGTTSNPID